MSEIADQVAAELSRRTAHASRWGARLAQVADEVEMREVLSLAVIDEAETVSRLDLAAMPVELGARYTTFVAAAACIRALDLFPEHPLRTTLHGIAAAGSAVLAEPGFITELAEEIVRHTSARRVRCVALAMMRAEDASMRGLGDLQNPASTEEGPEHG